MTSSLSKNLQIFNTLGETMESIWGYFWMLMLIFGFYLWAALPEIWHKNLNDSLNSLVILAIFRL